MNDNQNSNVKAKDEAEDRTPSQSSGAGKTQNSSSSGTTGTSSSSAGTGTTVSSAETVPTQEVQTIPEEEAEEQEPWGLLHPIDRSFYPMDLKDDEYTFGRGLKCSYAFDVPSIRHTQNFKSYSKHHFTITRIESGSSGSYTIMLKDESMNGTFVNGERLPEKGSRQLLDKDEIGMNVPAHRVFLFIDKNKEEDPNLPQKFKDKYILHKVLGVGAFGEVREALSKFGMQRHAVKIINKQKTIFGSQDPGKVDQDVMKEARLLLPLRHPCIISVNDVINSEQNLYIILELASGGDLFNRVSRKRMSEYIAKLMFFQMASAVAYLHDNNVTHRDLKPENILMMSTDDECLIKITDFGVSRLVGETSLMKTQAGTPTYLAPEIVHSYRSRSHEGYTRKVDGWSLGVILYICLASYPPFARDRRDTDQDLVTQIIRGNYNFNHSNWKDVSDAAKNMVRRMLTVEAKERHSPKQALGHEWLQDEEMKRKASELMAGTLGHSATENDRIMSRIEGENGGGINIMLNEDASSASTKSLGEARRAEKRPHSASTSREASQNSDESGDAHLAEKHFAASSCREPNVPESQNICPEKK